MRSIPSTYVKIVPSSNQLVCDLYVISLHNSAALTTCFFHVALNLGDVISHQSHPWPCHRPAHTDMEMEGGGSGDGLMDGGSVVVEGSLWLG